jgi:DNA topoisomerase I
MRKRQPVPVEARQAGLRYVRDDQPGLRRLRSGRGFRYVSERGRTIRDPAVLSRIRALAIPPAWTDVWICRLPHGHIQATGRDQRGRKQYRYHAQWRNARDETKFDRLAEFGRALPAIHRAVRRDLRLPGLPCRKVLAAVVLLLESTMIRVGNEEYARQNGSFGLTTMRNRHVRVNGSTIQFRFQGKSGRSHEASLTDPRLARLVRRCRDLPGQELFQYLDESNEPQPVSSSDVNAYLREVGGQEFTAKDFRTWAGTTLAIRHLPADRPDSRTAAKREINRVVAQVAAELGNTPTVCRKCYIHPAIFEAFTDGRLAGGPNRGQRLSHRRLLAALRRCLRKRSG